MFDEPGREGVLDGYRLANPLLQTNFERPKLASQRPNTHLSTAVALTVALWTMFRAHGVHVDLHAEG